MDENKFYIQYEDEMVTEAMLYGVYSSKEEAIRVAETVRPNVPYKVLSCQLRVVHERKTL